MFLGSGGYEHESPQPEEGVFTYWKELQSVSHWSTTINLLTSSTSTSKEKEFLFSLKANHTHQL